MVGNLRRRKERYYRSNLEVILRSIPSYDGHTLVEAIRMCLDRGIYNGESVRNLCECVRRNSGEIPEMAALIFHNHRACIHRFKPE